jgi:hypothetical protein
MVSSFTVLWTIFWFFLMGVRAYQQHELKRALGNRYKEFDISDQPNPSVPQLDCSCHQEDASISRTEELRMYLLSLVGGKEDTVNDLVEASRRKKPFMNEKWYLEKAINDLIRDRSC